MIRIINHGSNGFMGQVVSRMAGEDPAVEVAALVDARGGDGVYSSLSDVKEQADVIIDFSTASAVEGLLAYAVEKKIPVVLCTTGLNEEQTACMKKAAESIAILKSANMSIGINLMRKLLAESAQVLGPAGYDMEIVEHHHTRKLDAPSGTAIALAEALNEGLTRAEEEPYEYIYDRSTRRAKRPKDEIGISAVRAGNIVGYHEVIMAGEDEIITITHRATSRNLFAKGALAAAKFLAVKEPGLYDMSDVIA